MKFDLPPSLVDNNSGYIFTSASFNGGAETRKLGKNGKLYGIISIDDVLSLSRKMGPGGKSKMLGDAIASESETLKMFGEAVKKLDLLVQSGFNLNSVTQGIKDLFYDGTNSVVNEGDTVCCNVGNPHKVVFKDGKPTLGGPVMLPEGKDAKDYQPMDH